MRRGRDREFDSFVAARLPTLLRSAYLLCGDAGRARVLVEDALAAALRHRVPPDEADAYVERHVLRALLRGTGGGWRGQVGDRWRGGRAGRRAEAPVAGATGSEAPDAGATGSPTGGSVIMAKNGTSAGAGTFDDRGAGMPPAGSDPHELVWNGLAALPARERALLVLRHGEHRSDVDIAEQTGLRLATVRGSLAAGMAALPQLRDRPRTPAAPSRVTPAQPVTQAQLAGRADPGREAPATSPYAPVARGPAASPYAPGPDHQPSGSTYRPPDGYQRPHNEDAYRRPVPAASPAPKDLALHPQTAQPHPAQPRPVVVAPGTATTAAAPTVAGPVVAVTPADYHQRAPHHPDPDPDPDDAAGPDLAPTDPGTAKECRRGEELWGRPR